MRTFFPIINELEKNKQKHVSYVQLHSYTYGDIDNFFVPHLRQLFHHHYMGKTLRF